MKKVVIALLVVVLLATLGLGGYAIWKLNDKIDEQNEKILKELNEIKDDSSKNVTNQNTANNLENNTVSNVAGKNATSNTTANSGTEYTSLKEQIKNAYNKRWTQDENVLECRIEGVEILSSEEIKSEPGYGTYYKDGDILARVRYSIKLKDIHGSGAAGNGSVSGDWIIDKEACIVYKDGEIVQEGTSF